MRASLARFDRVSKGAPAMNASVDRITTTTVRRARRRDPRVRSIVQSIYGERGGRARHARVGSTGPRDPRDSEEDAEREGRPERETMSRPRSLDVRRRDRPGSVIRRRTRTARSDANERRRGASKPSTTMPIEHAIEAAAASRSGAHPPRAPEAPTARSQPAFAGPPRCRASRWRRGPRCPPDFARSCVAFRWAAVDGTVSHPLVQRGSGGRASLLRHGGGVRQGFEGRSAVIFVAWRTSFPRAS